MCVICEISKQSSIHMNFGNSAKTHFDRVHCALSETISSSKSSHGLSMFEQIWFENKSKWKYV